MAAQTILFLGELYTTETLLSMSMSQLVDLYNDIYEALGSEQRTTRFSDKSTGATRCLKALRAYEGSQKSGLFSDPIPFPAMEVVTAEPEVEAAPEVTAEPEVEAAPARKVPTFAALMTAPTGKATATEKAQKKHKGTDLKPTGKPLEACRNGSKQALLRDALLASGGATMEQLIEALSGGRKPWIEATVRSGFGWDMKLKGYGVCSVFGVDGVERFQLVWPEGQVPPAHK